MGFIVGGTRADRRQAESQGVEETDIQLGSHRIKETESDRETRRQRDSKEVIELRESERES